MNTLAQLRNELRASAESLISASARGCGRAELREGTRQLFAHIKTRLALEEVIKHEAEAGKRWDGPPPRITTDRVVHYLGCLLEKQNVTIYSWLADSDAHYPIQWHLLDFLRLQEYALADGCKCMKEAFANQVAQHDAAAKVPVPKRRSRAGKRAAAA